MAEPFKDENDIRKFWAYVMSRVDLDAPRMVNMRWLSGFADEMEALLQENVSSLNPFKRKLSRAYNQEKDYILGHEQDMPTENPDLIPLKAIRQHIKDGRYDLALQALDFDAGQLRKHHGEFLQTAGEKWKTKLDNLAGLQRKVLRCARMGLQAFSFQFTGQDTNIDIQALDEIIHKEGCFAVTAGELRGQEAMGNGIEFALTPHAINNIRRLAEQYPSSMDDKIRYEKLAFTLTQPHIDHSAKSAAARVETVRGWASAKQRGKNVTRQIVDILNKDVEKDRETGRQRRFVKRLLTALDDFAAAKHAGDDEAAKKAFFRVEEVVAGAIQRNLGAINEACSRGR